MSTITQTITALPTTPNPNTPSTFNTLAYPFTVAQAAMGPEMNTMATQMNTVAGEVNVAAAAAAVSAAASDASADLAVITANFVGAWSGLTGAKTAGISVSHLGSLWVLINNIADVTASVPGTSGDWTKFSGTYYEERSSNTIFSALDAGKFFKYTSGTFSQTFDPAASLAAGWFCYAYNGGSGVVTLDPSSTELINGASTLALLPGEIAFIYCTGSALKAVKFMAAVGDQSVVVTTGNGHGSTNNKVRRFTTTQSSAGTAITYADSAANGGSFTINETGLYAISYMDVLTGGGSVFYFGVSVNSAQLTTSIESITAADRLTMAKMPAANTHWPVSVTVRLTAGDVVRAHTDGTVDSVSAVTSVFRIRKIGV